MDVPPANPVRSERKQPQWAVYGSSSLPLNDSGVWCLTMNQEATSAYRVLARKYRPETFSALIGQEALVRTLTNALSLGRLAHAFVLTGVRGIGKTSTARLLAKGLNCIGPDGTGGATLEPCGQCEPCQAIARGRHVDVLEIDAASHTGVDDAREIIEGVSYRSVSARYKIYIIDEVHMMSKNAFNALLKTLEEPPDGVKFIFATTEIRKVPVTILSRCQRYDLRRVPSGMLAEHLTMICEKEEITADAEAVAMIARAAEGSVRDALSMLDQAAAMTADTLSAASVGDMLGRPGRRESMAVLSSALAGDSAASLAAFASAYATGAEAEMVIADLLDLVHQASMKASGGSEDAIIEGERAMIDELAALGIARLGRAWQILLKGHGEIQNAPHPAAACEMLLIRLAHTANMPTPGEILQKLPTAPASPAPNGSTAGSAAVPTSGSASSGTSPDTQEIASSAPITSTAPAAPQMTDMAPPSDNTTPQMAASAVKGDRTPMTATALSPAPITQPETPAGPVDLADIVTLAEDKGEMLLAARIRNHIRLVSMQPGSLEVALTEHAPEQLAGDLAKYLSQWTDRRWLVSLADHSDSKTLAEIQRAAEDEHRAQIAATPVIATILETFPGATIDSIKPVTAAQMSGDTLDGEEDSTS